MNNLSVIIPFYDCEISDQVINSALTLNPLEVIVVGFKLKNRNTVEDPRVKLIELNERAYPGHARNIGVAQSKAEVLLFLDSDVVLTPKTITYILNYDFDNLQDKLLFGLYQKDSFSVLTSIQTHIQRYRFKTVFPLDKLPYGQSSHLLLSRKTYERIGPMSSQLRMREDTEYCIRAKFRGVNSAVDKNFEALHLKRLNYFSLIGDYFLRTFYAIYYLKKFPSVFSQTNMMTTLSLKASWILSGLLLVVPLALSLLAPTVILPIALFLFLIPLILMRALFQDLTFLEKLVALLIWPFIGFASSLGYLLGTIRSSFESIAYSLIQIKDWITISFRVVRKNGNPIHIVHFITSTCNMRCPHCFYSETLNKPDRGELDLSINLNFTSQVGPLLWYAIGGGEPFMRQDLSSLLGLIIKNNRPKILTIPTNGWYTNETYNVLLEILQGYPNQKIILQFSIDGDSKLHNNIRREHSFERISETIRTLKSLQKIYPNLHLAIITTVTEDNHQLFPHLIDQLIERFSINQININLVRGNSYRDPMPSEKVIIAYKSAIDRYQWHLEQGHLDELNIWARKFLRAKEKVQKKLIYSIASEQKYLTPCLAGNLNYVIWEDGKVTACEMRNEVLGNIKNDSFKSMIHSKNAQVLRQDIVENQCKCTYECAMSINSFFSYPYAINLYKEILLNSNA